MATKKKPPKPDANGAPSTSQGETEPKKRRMTRTQRERLARDVQERAARLRAMADERQGEWVAWHLLIGSHADAPEAFEEAMRIGREWRESFRPKSKKAGSVDVRHS